ncbi:DNA mismatch repair protein MutH [Streptococcus parasanguinis]|uniref:MutH/Sau3AI family endonuclease n=1 Tax=Streptococcus parasanguinis TaxID=1318 RepID=UPI0019133079|nr:MutH/Sau3AI family endonuclease [Streptococcus parasanguinis]MBK5127853.1 DNA mismatch repair protein MutH [Streptococcus parasanguinis]
MKLKDAEKKLNKLVNKKFKELFNDDELQIIKINKGRTGQLLELSLDMKLSNTNRDFEDGELKTNKCNSDGKPLETIFITQISGMFDDLIRKLTFEKTSLFEKIDNILYVPVSKDGHPEDWFFLPSIHVDLNLPKYNQLRIQLEEDYYVICDTLRQQIEDTTKGDGNIHTANGKYIQVRSKDAKPYHPIYSNIYEREISNKNHAFYFKKDFVDEIRRISGVN